MWPQSVPGWQPSCERLPPASWAVVGLGVGMMALCCAVACCVENRVAVVPLLIVPRCLPAGNNTAIYRQPTQLSQHCRYWVFLLSMSSSFKGAIADNLHDTQLPPQVDHSYTSTYIHIFILSRYPGTMTIYFKVLGSQCHCSMLLDVLLLMHCRNSCLCPEIMSTNNITRQARPVEQNMTF